MNGHDFLFRGNEMSAVLEAQRKLLRSKIGDLEANYICSVDETDLARSLADQYRIDVTVLDLSARTVEPREEKRQGRGDFGFFEYTVNVYSVSIPFTGEAVVFSFRPNLTDLNPPRATLDGHAVILVLEQRLPDAIALDKEVQNTTASI